MDGFAGRYIVRQSPEDEPHSKQYDYDLTEHVILIQEYSHRVKYQLTYMYLYLNEQFQKSSIILEPKFSCFLWLL